MGKYPIFVVSEYYDVLEKMYGWSRKQIEAATGLRAEMLQARSLQRYPNDRHVLAIIGVLDGPHYFGDKQLRLGDNAQRSQWQMQAPHLSMKLLIAELRSVATPTDLLHCAARRIWRISTNHKLWIESTREGLRMETAVQRLLESHLTAFQRSLDVEALVHCWALAARRCTGGRPSAATNWSQAVNPSPRRTWWR